MTILEAVKASLGYPLSENSFLLALTNRGLTSTDTYVIANKRSLDLANADCIHMLLTSPNISESGYSISLSEKDILLNIANGIYSKYGEKNPFSATVKFVSKW